MSFVQRLRMANMFPINSDIGNAKVRNPDDDEIYKIINMAKDLNDSQSNMGQGNGIQRVANVRNQPISSPMIQEQPQLRFGGVTGQSNPGADIMARGARDANNIYEGYKDPLPVAEKFGPSRDELFAKEYFDRQNKEKIVNSNIGQNERKIANEERRLDQADTRINNTDEATNRRLSVLESGNQAKIDAATTKQNEANTQKDLRRQSQKIKAQEALTLIDELQDEKGNLKPDAQTATGWSANVPMLEKFPGGIGTSAATGNAKINKLQGMLTLDLIKEMKEQSKTGATGFGQLNLRELGVLENSASMLASRNMSEPEFAKELSRIKERLQMILQDDNPNQSGNNVGNNDFEVLIDPSGVPRRIPKDKIDEAIKRGARRR